MANEKRLIAVDEWDTFFAEHIYNRCFRNEYEQGYTDALDRVDDWMDDHPTVDAVEVVHGRWEDESDEYEKGMDLRCLVCGGRADSFVGGTEDWYCLWKPNFCPHCGARMDGDEDDNDT